MRGKELRIDERAMRNSENVKDGGNVDHGVNERSKKIHKQSRGSKS